LSAHERYDTLDFFPSWESPDLPFHLARRANQTHPSYCAFRSKKLSRESWLGELSEIGVLPRLRDESTCLDNLALTIFGILLAGDKVMKKKFAVSIISSLDERTGIRKTSLQAKSSIDRSRCARQRPKVIREARFRYLNMTTTNNEVYLRDVQLSGVSAG
jgi:hypothetical protein